MTQRIAGFPASLNALAATAMRRIARGAGSRCRDALTRTA
ncbi:hypothetical protein SAMN04489859_102456 [Paracoccus alcaliphilus]|uniref:Uncharacterized protein n=1 Tax=Paracoccus alcaliphilus TaxID=34002 RepID=A0A1H8KTF7_9RHOB|nr:hypothetical protein SAMN04489859_102456 [Paracoccus alcaliphilus]